jgi:hypothetical protein
MDTNEGNMDTIDNWLYIIEDIMLRPSSYEVPEASGNLMFIKNRANNGCWEG